MTVHLYEGLVLPRQLRGGRIRYKARRLFSQLVRGTGVGYDVLFGMIGRLHRLSALKRHAPFIAARKVLLVDLFQ